MPMPDRAFGCAMVPLRRGMGKHKNVVATIMQAFMPLALVAILWTIVG